MTRSKAESRPATATATRRYRAVLLSFYRYLRSNPEDFDPDDACMMIVRNVRPGEPTPDEARWLKALDALLAASLGSDGEDEGDSDEETNS
jgi:hypothetical protein